MTRDGERQSALDGIRGLAILLVVFGHALVPYRMGAFAAAGVTVFFALSGFLITGILLQDRRSSGPRLRRFYARRWTRLAPPLFVMVAVVSLIQWPGVKPVGAALTWTSNYWGLWDNQIAPFGNTWSVSVEEQFYLAWPLLLAAVPRRHLRTAVAVLFGVLVYWRLWLVGNAELEYAYHAAEAAGCAIVAGAYVRIAAWRVSQVWFYVGLFGVVLISAAAAVAGGSWWMLVPFGVMVPAAMMVAAAGSVSPPAWLSARWLVFAGVTSYSVYLWHQPLPTVFGIEETPLGGAVGVTAGLAAWWLVERPLMAWRARQRSANLVDRERAPILVEVLRGDGEEVVDLDIVARC